MGCDIHAHIEYSEFEDGDGSPVWWHWTGPVFFHRNYVLFELMAGVRGDIWNAIVPARGIPANASYETRSQFTLLVTEDGKETYACTRAEAEHYVNHCGSTWVESGQSARVTHPDWHTPSWLTTSELVQVQVAYNEQGRGHWRSVDALIAAMKVFDPDMAGKARLVFWFDN